MHSKGQCKVHTFYECKYLGNNQLKIKQHLLLPSNIKLFMGFRWACLNLTLTNFKGQGQDGEHFDEKYRENVG